MKRACLALLLFAGCAPRPVQIASAPLAKITAEPEPSVEFRPRAAGVITLLGVELPEAGTTIGGHYQGIQYARQRGNLVMADGTRDRWMQIMRAAGDSAMIAAGFRVQIPGPPTSDAEPMRGVRFGLTATVTHLELKEIGYVEPFVIEASARVGWELLDLASGASVFEGRTNASVRSNDSLEAVVPRLLGEAMGRLMEHAGFRHAIMAPRPMYAQDLLLAEFARSIPHEADTVVVDRALQNMNAETGVLGGVVVLNGSRGFSASAVVISSDGLALAPAEVARQRWIWSRNFDGRTRAARVLRAAGEVALVELSCSERCETVLWDADTSLANRSRIVWVGGRAFNSNATMGVEYAWKSLDVRRSREGVMTWRVRGRPAPVAGAGVARPDGIVVGVATRTGVVPIARALADLKVRVNQIETDGNR